MKVSAIVPRLDWALFLDVDGTLLDLATTPAEVTTPKDLPKALCRVAHMLGGALALVSGRPVADIDALFRPLQLPSAGIHGLELSPNGGSPRQLASPMPVEQRRMLSATAQGLNGVLVEDKVYSMALHFRLTPAVRDVLRRRIELVLSSPAFSAYSLHPGKMLWEVRRKRINKGGAVRALMDEAPFSGRIPVFIGDDETDLDGFEGARRMGGLALPVGRAGAGLESAFAGPPDVRAWIASLPDVLGRTAK